MSELLVLGGTSFIGRHLVAAALGHGHTVSIFNRGRTSRQPPPNGVTLLIGDRQTGDYTALLGGQWDAVVDVSNYVPRAVNEAADALAGAVGHYVLVSTVSAYDPAGAHDVAESAPLQPTPPRPTETVDPGTYGALKADCERAAENRWDDRLAIVRPTYVAGPHDNTERFTWWSRRLADPRDLPLLVPTSPIQLVDARDLAAFLLRVAVERLTGPFDAVGPAEPIDLAGFCQEFAPDQRPPRLVEVPDSAVADGLALPLVVTRPEGWPLFRRSGRRARDAGLVTRSIAETATDMRMWDQARGTPPLRVGPDEATERRVLAGRG